jgi:hypothetical protein
MRDWILSNTVNIVPVCPHILFSGAEQLRPETYFLGGTLEVLRGCDAAFIIDPIDLSVSSGSRREVRRAAQWGKTLLTTEQEIIQYDN